MKAIYWKLKLISIIAVVLCDTGSYQLTILWSGEAVRGSPYRVTVSSGSGGEASKVTFASDALVSSGVGREVSCIVDTRRAGPGKCTCHVTVLSQSHHVAPVM